MQAQLQHASIYASADNVVVKVKATICGPSARQLAAASFPVFEDINPFMPNRISHCYELDESISNFRVAGWYFSFFIQILKETSVSK